MNKEEQNSEPNEYDEESFDNESSEDVSSDEESISEESSVGVSMEELLPDNSSIKSVQLDSDSKSDNNQTPDQIFNDVASVSSDDSEETQDLVSNEGNVELTDNSSTKLDTKSISPHEIDESESDDLDEDNLTENVKLLTLQNEEYSSEVVVPSENQNLETENNNDDDHISSCQESEIEFIVTSQTPTSFNSENYALHMELTRKATRSNTSLQQQRNAHRKSLSFSNERMREIERHNQILLRKILTQKPSKEFVNQKVQCPKLRTTTSAVNRKKQQRQIDLDNQVLKRKIEAIALRRPKII